MSDFRDTPEDSGGGKYEQKKENKFKEFIFKNPIFLFAAALVLGAIVYNMVV